MQFNLIALKKIYFSDLFFFFPKRKKESVDEIQNGCT